MEKEEDRKWMGGWVNMEIEKESKDSWGQVWVSINLVKHNQSTIHSLHTTTYIHIQQFLFTATLVLRHW